MKSNIFIICAIASAALISCGKHDGKNLSEWVNPLIGSDFREVQVKGDNSGMTKDIGRVMPAVGVPHGMTNWVAQTQATEKKCLSPYSYYQQAIQGFRGSHWLNGSCTQDYGSVTIMPEQDSLEIDPEKRASSFERSEEKATPFLYTVNLKDYDIFAEMTGLSHAGIFRFDFKKEGDHYFVIEPNSDEAEAFVNIDPEKKEITGFNTVHRIYQGWGKRAGFSGHFVVQFQDDFAEFGVWDSTGIVKGVNSANGSTGAWVKFSSTKPGSVIVKVAMSFTSIENARENMKAEIPEWDFDKVCKASLETWEDALGTVRIEGSNDDDKVKFYTALYEASFVPREFSDVDGSYPKFAGGEKIMNMENGIYYADFSAWDTFRALHPLLTIIYPEETADMANSLVLKGEQGGWLPTFPCWNSYTAEMIGDHCISIIGEAILKDIKGIDCERAYKIMRKNAFEANTDYESYKDGMGRRAMQSYLQYRYIPLEDDVKEAFQFRGQVSRTLEYAYDDFVLAEVAKKLGKMDDYEVLIKRAQNYKNVIDPEVGYARGRHADGTWLEPFDPFVWSQTVTEGTPYHYTWFVPQDVAGLIKQIGGKEKFTEKLDKFFDEGYYWHGNEPCHNIAYLSAYAGEPWKVQKRVHDIIQTQYETTPGGLSGNDDAGQMSAWLVFSMMGFYPVCPGMPYYVIGTPSFDKCVINLADGKKFTIEAPGASEGNFYIQSAKLNGKPYDKSWISHEDIMKGGKLSFVMGREPNKSWASSDESVPPSLGI